MIKFLLFMILTATGQVCAQEKIEELEQLEIRSYTPQKNGVSDLVFEARIDNLTEMLSKNLVLGKLVDVSFKIHWLSPSKYNIEVHGLPKGFVEIKSDLISLIKGKLEFVLPENFSEKFKGYALKAEPIANGKLIRAIDATYTMAVPEVDITIDKSGQLKTIETRATMSAVKTEFFHSPKSWSNNKLVLDKVVLTSKQGAANLTTAQEIDYISVNGVGFPSKITVKNVSEVTIPANGKEKEKKIKNEVGTTIRFSKYEVNSGKAQRYMNEGLKR
ncbi:MAG: hypothetical protein EHM20_01740 [Alphaproteobacteria bacterium]|nr:MAG: hypothetical protein EHM20_01740 [Alphaproteobacteria bacterium]